MSPGAVRWRTAPGVAMLACVLLAGPPSVASGKARQAPASARHELLRLTDDRPRTVVLSVTRPTVAVVLIARARRCASARPLRLTVRAGAQTLLATTLSSSRWRTLRATIRLGAGTHPLRVRASGGRAACAKVDIDELRLVAGPRTPTRVRPVAPLPVGVTPRGPRRRIPLGAALSTESLAAASLLRQTFSDDFDSLTPENAMKMAYAAPDVGRFRFDQADQLVELARSEGKRVRGHPLVWDQQLPGWVTQLPWTRPQMEQILHRWVTRMVTRYRSTVDQWDVINEPLQADGNLRPSVWMKRIGPDYIPLSFKWAREADPSAKLYLNEFDAELPGPKQEGLIRLLTELKEADVPIDGVGIQGHWSLAAPVNEAEVLQAARRMVAPGLDLEFTEVDVAVDGRPAEAERQSQEFAKAARICQSIAVCRRFTVWGVSDRFSWRGAALAPLLLDADLRRKPAYAAVRAALDAGR